jgi:hypothetical protein
MEPLLSCSQALGLFYPLHSLGARVLVAVASGFLVSVAQHACTAHGVVLHIIQCQQKFALLAIHVWLLPRNANHREDALGLSENTVHLLQRPSGSLRVEEVDNGKDGRIAGIG